MKARFARATSDLEQVLLFYREGLGMTELYSFRDHEGFDGVMLGFPDEPYHLEFTREAAAREVPRAPTAENLLVLYLPERVDFERRVERMRSAGFAPVASHNPYWDRGGVTFEDFEGYRVVLYQDDWLGE